jgi:magnesium transporter
MMKENPLSALQQAVEQQQWFALISQLNQLNAADVAEFLQIQSLAVQCRLVQQLQSAAYVFEFLPVETQLRVALALPVDALLHLLSSMHSDDRADLFQLLPQTLQQQVLRELEVEQQQQLQQLLTYPAESAGAIMSTDYVSLAPELTMQQAIEQLRQIAANRETLYLIYITNATHELVGVISLREIIQAAPNATIADAMTTRLIVGQVDEDQESIAAKLSHYDFLALPIVDQQQHLLGIVTYDDAMDVVQQEMTEDFLKGSAVAATSHTSLKTAPIFALYKKRVFWLVLLVFGSLLSGIGIAHFEEIIAQHIVLVFFLPLLVGSGGNAGSQSATLMVRAMATGDVHFKDWFMLLGRESLVALCLGATMACAVSVLGYLRGDIVVACVLALSMLGIVLLGSLIGMSLPFLLRRLNLDPASASAPLVTSICDATGVLVYLFIASQLLSGWS